MTLSFKFLRPLNKIHHPITACFSTSQHLKNAAPNFDNPQQAFQSKSTYDLIRACSILALCSKDLIVDNSLKLMRTGKAILGRKIFSSIMEKTFYGQFVAGETGPAVISAAKKLKELGLNLMVAPALESDLGEGTALGLQEKNLSEYLQLAELTSHGNFAGPLKPACLQMKMTALVPMDLLLQLSQIINRITEEDRLILVDSISNLIGGNDSFTCPSSLSKELLIELKNACERLGKLGSKVKATKVRLMVDMEWTYVNPACSIFTLAMMKVFNKDTPSVCSTVQCYLMEAMETLEFERKVAKHFGVCYGAKLVRGAYLEKETQVAPHLICKSYEETSKNYEKVMQNALKTALESRPGTHFIFVATHNEAVIKKATEYLVEQDASQHPNVAFAQIYGMAENISLPLAQANYLVYKSVAFGNLHQVMPYLARRAAENRAIMKGARRERELLMSEIKRRLLSK